MRNNRDAFSFLREGDHELILYSALKRLHLSPLHRDYEDYLQESRLLFLKAYHQFPDDPKAKPHQFLAYAQQKVYWALLDQLRRQRWQTEHLATGDHDVLLAALPANADHHSVAEAHVMQDRLLQTIRDHGTLGEWTYLTGTLINHLTASEIARRCQVSRQTVYRWRQSLLRRLRQHHFEFLSDEG